MEFFNKKEEVIDLKITQFGRHLLSKGGFKPVYYSFFDDNIVYNSSTTGLPEEQNDAEPRIKTTQTCKPQISFSPLEKEFGNSYAKILLEGTPPTSFQKTAEKNYTLMQPLGVSDANAEYAPSWSVHFLNGYLSGATDYQTLVDKTGGTNNVFIPQLDSHTEVKYINFEDISDDTSMEDEFEGGPVLSDIAITSTEEDMFVLMKIGEINGLSQKKNYDVELYEIEEEIQGDKTIETLRPLAFSVRHDPEKEMDFIDEVDPEEDITQSEYYFDIKIDDEIDDELLCKLDPVDDTLGAFADPRTQFCQDLLNKQKRKVFNIYENGIDSDPGEIC